MTRSLYHSYVRDFFTLVSVAFYYHPMHLLVSNLESVVTTTCKFECYLCLLSKLFYYFCTLQAFFISNSSYAQVCHILKCTFDLSCTYYHCSLCLLFLDAHIILVCCSTSLNLYQHTMLHLPIHSNYLHFVYALSIFSSPCASTQ